MHALARYRKSSWHLRPGWGYAQSTWGNAGVAGHFLPHFAHATRASSSSDMDGLHSSGSLSNEAPSGRAPGPAAQAPLHLHRGPQPVASKVMQPGAPHPRIL